MSVHLKKRLERFKEQLKKTTARIQATETKIKNTEQKNNIRKKILVGAYYLDIAEKNNTLGEIKAHMDTYLKKDFDRELFGLEPLSDTK